jgi:hypothetical protein
MNRKDRLRIEKHSKVFSCFIQRFMDFLNPDFRTRKCLLFHLLRVIVTLFILDYKFVRLCVLKRQTPECMASMGQAPAGKMAP